MYSVKMCEKNALVSMEEGITTEIIGDVWKRMLEVAPVGFT